MLSSIMVKMLLIGKALIFLYSVSLTQLQQKKKENAFFRSSLYDPSEILNIKTFLSFKIMLLLCHFE